MTTEEEALARLKQMRERYWDATGTTVYAYIIRDRRRRASATTASRGGTAGMPVLQVLRAGGALQM